MSYISCVGHSHLLRSAQAYSLNFTRDLKSSPRSKNSRLRASCKSFLLNKMVNENLLGFEINNASDPNLMIFLGCVKLKTKVPGWLWFGV